jgi:hypothetical protein
MTANIILDTTKWNTLTANIVLYTARWNTMTSIRVHNTTAEILSRLIEYFRNLHKYLDGQQVFSSTGRRTISPDKLLDATRWNTTSAVEIPNATEWNTLTADMEFKLK